MTEQSTEAGKWWQRFIDWLFPPKNFFVVEAKDWVDAIEKSGLPKPGEMLGGQQLMRVKATRTLSKNLFVIEWEFASRPLSKRYTMDAMQQVKEHWE